MKCHSGFIKFRLEKKENFSYLNELPETLSLLFSTVLHRDLGIPIGSVVKNAIYEELSK